MRTHTSLPRSVLALALVIVLSGGSARAEALPSEDLPGAIDNYLLACAAHGWAGAVVVAKDGKVLLRKGYGLADRAASRTNDAETMFEIASVSKVFTACAVMRLVELERLGLDDPIAIYLPDVPTDKSGITVRHLLTHTSGMSRSIVGGGVDVTSAVASYLAKPLAREPGTVAEYWNGGFALLAALIETVSGDSYQDFVRREVFARAGLISSGFTGDASLAPERQARGYDGDLPVRLAAEHPYRRYDYGYKGMGGIVTTAEDMWRFTEALLDNRILRAETRTQMESEHKSHRGLGWGVLESERGTTRLVHGGDVRGFHTAFEVLPTERAAIILMSNVEGIPMYKLQWNLQSLLFDEALRYPAPPTPQPRGKAEIDALLGEWWTPDGKDSLHVGRHGMGIEINASGLRAGAALSLDSDMKAVAGLVDKTLAVFAAIRGKDEETIRAALPKGVFWADSWPANLIQHIWPEQVVAWGELETVRVVGAASLGRGVTRIVLGLKHGKADRSMEALYSPAGALTRLDFAGPRYARSRVYMPSSQATFVAFDWHSERPTPALTIRHGERGAPTSLCIHDIEFFRR